MLYRNFSAGGEAVLQARAAEAVKTLMPYLDHGGRGVVAAIRKAVALMCDDVTIGPVDWFGALGAGEPGSGVPAVVRVSIDGFYGSAFVVYADGYADHQTCIQVARRLHCAAMEYATHSGADMSVLYADRIAVARA